MHAAPSTSTSTPGCIPNTIARGVNTFELRFNSLFTGRGLSFPCDANGIVDLDALSEQAQANLAKARNGIGRDYTVPQVLPVY